MERNIVQRVLEKTLTLYGFQKADRMYARECGDVTILIELQESKIQEGFYINYGYYVTKMHPVVDEATLLHCDYVDRFTMEDDSSMFSPKKLSAEECRIVLEDNIKKYIVPVMAAGRENGLELYP